VVKHNTRQGADALRSQMAAAMLDSRAKGVVDDERSGNLDRGPVAAEG
jgi:hypothetical protein